jgi:hypothetical protein
MSSRLPLILSVIAVFTNAALWFVVQRAQLSSPPPANFLEHGCASTPESHP